MRVSPSSGGETPVTRPDQALRADPPQPPSTGPVPGPGAPPSENSRRGGPIGPDRARSSPIRHPAESPGDRSARRAHEAPRPGRDGPRLESRGPSAERVGFEPTDELPRHLLSREARSTRLRHLSVLRPRSYTAEHPRPAYDAERSGGRADECTGLENRRPARVRGFESLPLRSTPKSLTWDNNRLRARGLGLTGPN